MGACSIKECIPEHAQIEVITQEGKSRHIFSHALGKEHMIEKLKWQKGMPLGIFSLHLKNLSTIKERMCGCSFIWEFTKEVYFSYQLTNFPRDIHSSLSQEFNIVLLKYLQMERWQGGNGVGKDTSQN